jgi:hypothetical protein
MSDMEALEVLIHMPTAERHAGFRLLPPDDAAGVVRVTLAVTMMACFSAARGAELKTVFCEQSSRRFGMQRWTK